MRDVQPFKPPALDDDLSGFEAEVMQFISRGLEGVDFLRGENITGAFIPIRRAIKGMKIEPNAFDFGLPIWSNSDDFSPHFYEEEEEPAEECPVDPNPPCDVPLEVELLLPWEEAVLPEPPPLADEVPREEDGCVEK